jgi:tetratricopeptide (TPR) repeat protein
MARAEMALFVGCLFVACGGGKAPEPKKVAEIEPVVQPRVRPKREGPFRNPKTDAPEARSGEQLPGSELEAAIAQGKALMAQGRATLAIQALRKCANKIPQSVACEAELAMTMFEAKQHLAHAKHFLLEAASAQPASDDDALLRRIGATAIARSQYPAARAAYGVLLARNVATADDLEQFALALQAELGHADEAADAYARAYVLDPSRHELLRKRATLLGQSGDHTRAAELFQTYVEQAKPDEKTKLALEQRIRMLREQAKARASQPAPAPDSKPTGPAKADKPG